MCEDVGTDLLAEGDRVAAAELVEDLGDVCLGSLFETLIGDWRRTLPLACLLAAALECESEGVLNTSFDGWRCKGLRPRVGVPLLGGRSSKGIGFVRPDLRRPSTMKAVGVWVVALFHGGEPSTFLFLEGFLAESLVVTVASFGGGRAFDSGVVSPFSAKSS